MYLLLAGKNLNIPEIYFVGRFLCNPIFQHCRRKPIKRDLLPRQAPTASQEIIFPLIINVIIITIVIFVIHVIIVTITNITPSPSSRQGRDNLSFL